MGDSPKSLSDWVPITSFSVLECYIVILSTFSHLVIKLLTPKLMQFLPLSNDHYHVVRFLLGNSPASDFQKPTFRNPLSVPPSRAGG